MLLSGLFALFIGAFAGNAFPHLIRGITKERYPSALGNGPVVNFVVGWAGAIIACLLAWLAWPSFAAEPAAASVGAALGVLAIGLFHAGPAAFGRKE